MKPISGELRPIMKLQYKVKFTSAYDEQQQERRNFQLQKKVYFFYLLNWLIKLEMYLL